MAPVEVASEIRRSVGILPWSMAAGPGCDAQYLFAKDILGTSRGHMLCDSKGYRSLAAKFDRLRAERVAAFRDQITILASGAHPEEGHILRMSPEDLAAFHKTLAEQVRSNMELIRRRPGPA